MDFALETGTKGHATHKIDRDPSGVWNFAVYEKRKFLWVIPYWHLMKKGDDQAKLEAWLQANWKLPAYFHITRKPTA